MPVLLREYLKVGGRLVVIDLRKTNPRILGRYMGKPEAAAFFATHHPVG